MADELKDLDLYALFGVVQSATTDEVKKAYRKKALTCHPDKNPDNPKAAEQFQQLSKALEVLLDVSARAAYDRVINAKNAAKLRHQELDSRRKKFKEELEAREREAELGSKYTPFNSKTFEAKLQEEIDRLRKDGSKQLQEEIELVRQHIHREMRNMASSEAERNQSKRIKVRWTAAKDDVTNGGYNNENLQRIFTKYGDIEVLILSKKKNGSALIEFTTSDPARKAEMLERGLPNNPLKVEVIDKVTPGTDTAAPPERKAPPVDKSSFNRDHETLVMRQLRQAEERKRLIQQMLNEEDT